MTDVSARSHRTVTGLMSPLPPISWRQAHVRCPAAVCGCLGCPPSRVGLADRVERIAPGCAQVVGRLGHEGAHSHPIQSPPVSGTRSLLTAGWFSRKCYTCADDRALRG